MASEFQGRNICVGYNFEQTPDTSSLHNLDRQVWYAFETNLAMRLLADFGKEAPASLARNCAASMSFLSQVAADPQMLPYPSRMPIGRGNKYYHRPWRYYPVTESAEICDTTMIVGDVDSFIEDYSAWLNNLEELTSFTIESSGSGLEVLSSSLSGSQINYELEAISVGLYTIEIVAESEIPATYEDEDFTFVANYEVDEHATWALGSATGTLNGTAAVTGGQLDLTGDVSSYASYSGTYNVPDGNLGCVRINVIPNYSGSPPTDYVFFSSDSNNDGLNRINIYHDTTGNIIVSLSDSAGATKGFVFAAFAPVAGTEYEIELNWDFDTGLTQLFLNGVSQGTDTRTATATTRGNIYVGTDALTQSTVMDAYIEELSIYSTVQHTADYTPEALADLGAITRATTRTTQVYVVEA